MVYATFHCFSVLVLWPLGQGGMMQVTKKPFAVPPMGRLVGAGVLATLIVAALCIRVAFPTPAQRSALVSEIHATQRDAESEGVVPCYAGVTCSFDAVAGLQPGRDVVYYTAKGAPQTARVTACSAHKALLNGPDSDRVLRAWIEVQQANTLEAMPSEKANSIVDGYAKARWADEIQSVALH